MRDQVASATSDAEDRWPGSAWLSSWQMTAAEPRPAADVYGTPEGHAVRFDEHGSVIGMTIVNARWLVEREGKITITVPSRIEASARELGPLLTGP